MRRARRLTSSERWELGLFLIMLVVGCLCLTALLNGNNLPRLFAFAAPALPDQPPLVIDPAPAPQASIPTAPLPLVPLAPVAPAMPVLPQPPALQPPPPPARATVAKKPAPDIRYYNGHKYIYAKTIRLRVTAYAPDIRCTWPYPGTTTASGLSVKTNRGRLVAADPRLIPLHSLVAVPGYAHGVPVPVLDTGGAIKGSRLDVLLPTFDQAKEWGTQLLSVRIYEPAD
ncbi:MAG TPA: 3D domain-containing protein [Phycisphaerae bacterium]|nr:3D domain-containing protein [Phycisphaerae bacterium]